MFMAYLFKQRLFSSVVVGSAHKKCKAYRNLLWKYTLNNTSETVVCTRRSGYLGFPATLQKHSFWMKIIILFKKIYSFHV